jgi:hypothetical protein
MTTASAPEGAAPPPRLYTREEISAALNKGADMVLGRDGDDYCETSATIRDADLVNLTVNAIGEILDDPDISLDDVIGAAYSTDPEEVRGWVS